VGSINLTLKGLICKSLFVILFRACAESQASENASRLIAMQRVEKNIKEELFNRLYSERLISPAHACAHAQKFIRIKSNVVSEFEAMRNKLDCTLI